MRPTSTLAQRQVLTAPPDVDALLLGDPREVAAPPFGWIVPDLQVRFHDHCATSVRERPQFAGAAIPGGRFAFGRRVRIVAEDLTGVDRPDPSHEVVAEAGRQEGHQPQRLAPNTTGLCLLACRGVCAGEDRDPLWIDDFQQLQAFVQIQSLAVRVPEQKVLQVFTQIDQRGCGAGDLQLRIPLGDGNYVNLWCAFGRHHKSAILIPWVESLRVHVPEALRAIQERPQSPPTDVDSLVQLAHEVGPSSAAVTRAKEAV